MFSIIDVTKFCHLKKCASKPVAVKTVHWRQHQLQPQTFAVKTPADWTGGHAPRDTVSHAHKKPIRHPLPLPWHPDFTPEHRPAGLAKQRSEQQLGNLHGIQRGALLDLVAADEQVEPGVARPRDVAPHAPDEHAVAVAGVQRRGEAVGRAVVDDGHARRSGQRLQRLRARGGASATLPYTLFAMHHLAVPRPGMRPGRSAAAPRQSCRRTSTSAVHMPSPPCVT